MKAIKQHPVLFQAEMVRAILNGTKTQTRRIADVEDAIGANPGLITPIGSFAPRSPENHLGYYKYQAGDQLWVREAWRPIDKGGNSKLCKSAMRNHRPEAKPRDLIKSECEILYRASEPLLGSIKWKPSIFMPRWASRILLDVTGIRLERLHDISEEDARKEGIDWNIFGIDEKFLNYMDLDTGFDCPVKSYFSLWEKINGKQSLDSNPWVWVTDFNETKEAA